MSALDSLAPIRLPSHQWWEQRLTRARPHVAPLGIVVLCCAVAQIITLRQVPLVYEWPDSATYLPAAHRILASGQIFGLERTPGYPAFLAVIFVLSGGTHLRAVVLAQAGLMVLSMLEIYILAYRLSTLQWLACAVAALISLDLYIVDWERTILTETLAFWVVVSLFLAFERYARHETVGALVALVVLSVAAILVRPIFLYLPLLLMGVLILWSMRRHTLRARWKQLGLALACTYLLVLAYSFGNGLVYGYTTLTTTSNINMFGKVLEYHMQNETSDARYADLKMAVNAYLASAPSNDVSPSGFVEAYPQYQSDSYALLGDFAKSVFIQHPVEFAVHTYPDVLASWTTGATLFYAPYSTPRLTRAIFVLANGEQELYLLLPLALIFLTIWTWRYPQRTSSFVLLALLLAVAGGVVVGAAAAWNEFYRLRFPLDWAMIVAALLLAADLLSTALGRPYHRSIDGPDQ